MFQSSAMMGGELNRNCEVVISQQLDGFKTCFVKAEVVGEDCAQVQQAVWISPNGAFTDVSPLNISLNASVPGTYTLFITLTDGCVITSSITVSEECEEKDPPECECSVEIEYGEDNYGTCVAHAVVKGDCEVKSVVWVGPNGAATHGPNGINASVAGKYYVIVTFADGCQEQACITITEECEPCEFDIEIGHNNSLCGQPNGAVYLNTVFPFAGFTVEWTNANGEIVGNTHIVECLPAGIYTVVVTSPSGCIGTGSVTIENVQFTIIDQDGGDTGLHPNDGAIVSGIKLTGGTELTWEFAPQWVPDEMIIQWSADPSFTLVTELINTGPVTSLGSDCIADFPGGSAYMDCISLLLIGDFDPNTNLDMGNGIDFLPDPGTAQTNSTNSTECTDQKRIIGCVTIPEDGWVRLIVNPNVCKTSGTAWSVTVSCTCSIKLHEQHQLISRASTKYEQPRHVSTDVNWIYPNPSQGLIYFNTDSEINDVEVYDTVGKIVSQKSGVIESVDLSHLNPGIYLVKMKGAFGDRVQKITLQ